MTRPEKGTPEYELWLCAIDVAMAAPWKQGQYAFAAQIPWDDINRLREALDTVGIDWRVAKERDDEAKAKMKARREAEITAKTMTGPSHPYPIHPPEDT